MPAKLHLKKLHLMLGAAVAMIAVSLLLVVRSTAARTAALASPMHPTFTLLDADGVNVLDSGAPVSTVATCGQCHDTAFITEHNTHKDNVAAGLIAPSGEVLLVSEDGSFTELADSFDAEISCLLCHTEAPDNAARLEALASGEAAWANTAALLNTGIVERSGDGYTWNSAAFDEAGLLVADTLRIQDPTVDNCAQCHGAATTDAVTPLDFNACDPAALNTFASGEVFAPQRISESALNVSGKNELARTWDVHSERIVACTDCHYSVDNPAFSGTTPSDLEHLNFDPRQPELGEYLNQPDHSLASSADDPLARECGTCHDAEATHGFLPYVDRHVAALACESCHTPRLIAPAAQTIDWTTGEPASECRGVSDAEGDIPLMTGYQPVLTAGEDGRIAPHNLTTSWYWVAGADGQPVPLVDVRAAYDANPDDMASALSDLGYADPRIVGTVESRAIHHSVVEGDYATRDCDTCHTDDSALAAPMVLAASTPGGAVPAFGGDVPGSLERGPDGTLYFKPDMNAAGTQRYVFGMSRVSVIDWVGAGLFVLTIFAVIGHGGLRFFAARRNGRHTAELEEAYMYGIYERLWHWLQTATIGLLLFTGLIIHRPEMFGMFSFAGVVIVHNVVAAILLINAALAAFYHFASGEIRQFLPHPHGLFDQLFRQGRFYMDGIFRREPHPFEKGPGRKMNPLQQITYLGLLNVLLPLQVITGALMWAAGQWPAFAARLGGLTLLAPIHSMVAWLFASFIVGHVYLTTTGATPLTSLRGMIMGWEDVEAPAAETSAAATD